MLTKQEQLDALHEGDENVHNTFIELVNDINQEEIVEPLSSKISLLIAFTNEIMRQHRTKSSLAEHILNQWVKFNETMNSDPNVSERWGEIMTILAITKD